MEATFKLRPDGGEGISHEYLGEEYVSRSKGTEAGGVAGPESEGFFSDQDGQPLEVCSRAWHDLTGLKRYLLPHHGEHTAM